MSFEGDRIAAAKYHTVGCGPTIAECRGLTADRIIEALDGMPPDKLHCPALAIGALQDALSKWPGSPEVTKANGL